MLVNNAGALENKPFSETTTAIFESVYRARLCHFAYTVAFTLIDLKGQVLNISSIGGVDGSSKFPDWQHIAVVRGG